MCYNIQCLTLGPESWSQIDLNLIATGDLSSQSGDVCVWTYLSGFQRISQSKCDEGHGCPGDQKGASLLLVTSHSHCGQGCSWYDGWRRPASRRVLSEENWWRCLCRWLSGIACWSRFAQQSVVVRRAFSASTFAQTGALGVTLAQAVEAKVFVPHGGRLCVDRPAIEAHTLIDWMLLSTCWTGGISSRLSGVQHSRFAVFLQSAGSYVGCDRTSSLPASHWIGLLNCEAILEEVIEHISVPGGSLRLPE